MSVDGVSKALLEKASSSVMRSVGAFAVLLKEVLVLLLDALCNVDELHAGFRLERQSDVSGFRRHVFGGWLPSVTRAGPLVTIAYKNTFVDWNGCSAWMNSVHGRF